MCLYLHISLSLYIYMYIYIYGTHSHFFVRTHFFEADTLTWMPVCPRQKRQGKCRLPGSFPRSPSPARPPDLSEDVETEPMSSQHCQSHTEQQSRPDQASTPPGQGDGPTDRAHVPHNVIRVMCRRMRTVQTLILKPPFRKPPF